MRKNTRNIQNATTSRACTDANNQNCPLIFSFLSCSYLIFLFDSILWFVISLLSNLALFTLYLWCTVEWSVDRFEYPTSILSFFTVENTSSPTFLFFLLDDPFIIRTTANSINAATTKTKQVSKYSPNAFRSDVEGLSD